jgi:hypothetical protein
MGIPNNGHSQQWAFPTMGIPMGAWLMNLAFDQD